ncbi:deoxynucleotidyltransferase terminal-interacting protein 2 isoform X2 [Garra rufa]|uniref:deoxynucleotidyltransferase terminal-interacting protein 2 isoform X2 n=1 Tax=Garra rufa TaxID=137080 RepID=UPI003CCEF67E
MVATRRGTRVGSPVKNTSDESSGATPTPSTRRTRRTTVMEENQSQSELADDSQQGELKDDSTASSSVASPPKRNTRRSTRHLADKKQSSSTHEADVSESESCCSVVSDVQAKTRTRRRTAVREKPAVQDEASEAESSLSEVSATNSRSAPRSLRKRVLTSAAATKDHDDDPSGSKSHGFAMDTRQTTRSHRKPAVPSTEPDSSEPESCVSGLRSSVVRRTSRNQKVKPVEPIPLNLEETTDTPSSPMSKKRGRRPKTEVDDKNDSDGCKSGPSMSPWRSTRRQPKADTLVGESDSESVATDVCASQGSPSPRRGRGTPCSSRTGSASSTCGGPSTSLWRSTRRKPKPDILVGESDSELVGTDVCASQGSPRRGRGRGTPCSSRTGSASSTCVVSVTRTRSNAKLTSDLDDTITTSAMPEEQGVELEPHHERDEIGDKAEDTVEQLDSTVTMDTSEAQECTMIEERAEDTTVVFDQDELIEMQKPQSSIQDVESVEDSAKPVAEEPGEVTMENDEPEVMETSHVVEDQTCSEPVKEDTVEAVAEDLEPAVVEEAIENQTCAEPVNQDVVEITLEDSVPTVVEEHENKVQCEKSVIVYEEVKTIEDDTVTLDDLEGPSTSSHTQAYLTATEETSKKPSPQRKMISLLDSSEDEDSADEDLNTEEEGCSQKAEDVQSEDHVVCHDRKELPDEADYGLFAIDTTPGILTERHYYADAKQNEEVDEEDFVDEEKDDDDDEDSQVLFAPRKLPQIQLSSAIDTGLKMKELGGLYISFDANKPKNLSECSKTQKDLNTPDVLLKKSVIVPDFEKKDAVPPYNESKHATKLKRKAEREKTTGDGWFNMRAPELTEELKNDLKALKMRGAMDPKHFYKKNDREGFPKYFQVGTVVDSPEDFYSSRIPKKERKRTIVEELLADAEFRNFNKRKYQEIMAEKAAQAAGKMKKKHHTSHKKKMNK